METGYRVDAWLPTTKKEVEARGWDYLDVILFSGDAYVDHPSFGAAASVDGVSVRFPRGGYGHIGSAGERNDGSVSSDSTDVCRRVSGGLYGRRATVGGDPEPTGATKPDLSLCPRAEGNGCWTNGSEGVYAH